jgi:hypothetical protein
MKCAQLVVGIVVASLLFPAYLWLVGWMKTLVDERDATSIIGFVAWSAFFFYLAVRILLASVSLGVDKSRPVK